MKKLLSIALLFVAIITCSSCDILLYSLVAMAEMSNSYSTPYYSTPTYSSGYSTSSTYSSSSSSGSSYLIDSYRRFEKLAQDNYNSYQREKNSSHPSATGLSGFSTQYHSNQRELRRIRQEAQKEGINIPASYWETKSL